MLFDKGNSGFWNLDSQPVLQACYSYFRKFVYVCIWSEEVHVENTSPLFLTSGEQ